MSLSSRRWPAVPALVEVSFRYGIDYSEGEPLLPCSTPADLASKAGLHSLKLLAQAGAREAIFRNPI